MKYYVIINGESSLDIQGLAIESLPSISKPLMRSKREEIDGRNGDIITQLGYGAYDKTLKIGLWGDYDINEVITFFNQDGIITFSNEPDMYYNFTILNRIDFINQLEAFRKATITIHCQPFKYKEEETEELEIITKEVSGTNISVNDAVDGAMNIILKGNTSQVQLSGINIFNINGIYSTSSTSGLQRSYENGIATLTWTSGFSLYMVQDDSENNFIPLPDSTKTYTISFKHKGDALYLRFDESNTNIISTNVDNNYTTYSYTFTNLSEIKIKFVRKDNTGTAYLTDFQVEEGSTATPFEQYCGGTPSPNPSYPQDIHNVSGNNSIEVCGKNLFDKDTMVMNSAINAGNGNMTSSDNFRTAYIKCKPNTTYSISKILSNRFAVGFTSDKDLTLPKTLTNVWANQAITTKTITSPNNAYYMFITLSKITDDTTPIQDILDSLQVEINETPTTYEAYNGTTYPINLGSIELCKIGTYQDYFYKEDDKWYLHKEINNYQISGNENWQQASSQYTGTYSIYLGLQYIEPTTAGTQIYCNYFKGIDYLAQEQGITKNTNTKNTIIRIDTNVANTLNGIKQWLQTNKPTLYYPLETPTNTEITDTTLIEQLNAIKSANSYYGTTNINQVNNDMPFILDVSYLSGTDNITITNHGNYFSKPKLTLTGTGNIGIYLNDSQIFQVALGTDETIIIDTDKMEAYYESTLKNRQVIGDYNSFKLLSGENTIKISGTFSKLQVDNYSRWI